jgi:hypothetical protein
MKVAIYPEKVAIYPEKVAIYPEKVSIVSSNPLSRLGFKAPKILKTFKCFKN